MKDIYQQRWEMGSFDNLQNENCQYSSSFSWCHFRLWTTSQGIKQIMNKQLPPQRCKKSIKWLCDHVLSRNRRLARRKALTSSELNRLEFRPKKGGEFLPPPSALPFKGEAQRHVSKGTKSSWVWCPRRQKKGTLVRDSGPKMQICAGRAAPRGGEVLRTTELGNGRHPAGLARFLLLSPRGPTASY